MITTEQFENRLIEYLDGELSDAEKREMEEYLQAHPEAMDLKGDFSLLGTAGKTIRESTFPADLLLEANRKLAARLADSRQEHVASAPVASSNGSPEVVPSRTWLPNWRRRFRPPVLAAALATLAILLVAAVTQRAALADIASSLLQRITVTFNDESLSASQQQTFDELVEITETVDENGDQAVTVNFGGATEATVDQILQELGDKDGVLSVVISGDSSAVFSDLDSDSIVVNLISSRAMLDLFSAASPDDITEEDGVLILRVDPDSLPPAAKIGSQSPNVTEDQSWGDIKKAVGSSTDHTH